MLQSNGVMFGWDRSQSGREAMAGELFAHTVSYFEKLKGSNQIESYETVFLAQHGGDLGGFFMIKGTHAQLDTMGSSDEWIEIVLRAGHCLTGLGIIEAYTGAAVPEMMMRWSKSIPAR